MERLQAFRAAAHEGGFVIVTESAEGTVLWLRKKVPETTRETRQRICINSLTNSVTAYWMAASGKVDSKDVWRRLCSAGVVQAKPGNNYAAMKM